MPEVTENLYNVQCLQGHYYRVPAGSDLEQRCKEREEKGFLDALILSQEECEECQMDREFRLAREAE